MLMIMVVIVRATHIGSFSSSRKVAAKQEQATVRDDDSNDDDGDYDDDHDHDVDDLVWCGQVYICVWLVQCGFAQKQFLCSLRQNQTHRIKYTLDSALLFWPSSIFTFFLVQISPKSFLQSFWFHGMILLCSKKPDSLYIKYTWNPAPLLSPFSEPSSIFT